MSGRGAPARKIIAKVAEGKASAEEIEDEKISKNIFKKKSKPKEEVQVLPENAPLNSEDDGPKAGRYGTPITWPVPKNIEAAFDQLPKPQLLHSHFKSSPNLALAHASSFPYGLSASHTTNTLSSLLLNPDQSSHPQSSLPPHFINTSKASSPSGNADKLAETNDMAKIKSMIEGASSVIHRVPTFFCASTSANTDADDEPNQFTDIQQFESHHYSDVPATDSQQLSFESNFGRSSAASQEGLLAQSSQPISVNTKPLSYQVSGQILRNPAEGPDQEVRGPEGPGGHGRYAISRKDDVTVAVPRKGWTSAYGMESSQTAKAAQPTRQSGPEEPRSSLRKRYEKSRTNIAKAFTRKKEDKTQAVTLTISSPLPVTKNAMSAAEVAEAHRAAAQEFAGRQATHQNAQAFAQPIQTYFASSNLAASTSAPLLSVAQYSRQGINTIPFPVNPVPGHQARRLPQSQQLSGRSGKALSVLYTPSKELSKPLSWNQPLKVGGGGPCQLYIPSLKKAVTRYDGRGKSEILLTHYFGLEDASFWDPAGDTLVFFGKDRLCRTRFGVQAQACFRISSAVLLATGSSYFHNGLVQVDRTYIYDTPGNPNPIVSMEEFQVAPKVACEMKFSWPAKCEEEGAFRFYINIRNALAIIYDLPLIGETLWGALLDVNKLLEKWLPEEDVILRIIQYVEKHGLHDVVNNPWGAVGLLAWSEHESVRWDEGYREFWTHCVGMYDKITYLEEFKSLSPTSAHLLRMGYMQVKKRLEEVGVKLKEFNFEGILNTLEINGHPIVSADHPVRQSFRHFAKFLTQYYTTKFGKWPCEIEFKEPHWLTKDILTILEADFGVLYEYLVDRDVVWSKDGNKLVHLSNRSFAPNIKGLPIQEILVKFDEKKGYPHIPCGYPLVPESTQCKPRNSVFVMSGHEDMISPVEAGFAYIEATNTKLPGFTVVQSDFLNSFMKFEETANPGEMDPFIARQGRWLLIYAVLQIIPTVLSPAPKLEFLDDYKGDIHYHVCANFVRTPWVSPKQFVQEETYNPHLGSYCWTAKEKWQDPPPIRTISKTDHDSKTQQVAQLPASLPASSHRSRSSSLQVPRRGQGQVYNDDRQSGANRGSKKQIANQRYTNQSSSTDYSSPTVDFEKLEQEFRTNTRIGELGHRSQREESHAGFRSDDFGNRGRPSHKQFGDGTEHSRHDEIGGGRGRGDVASSGQEEFRGQAHSSREGLGVGRYGQEEVRDQFGHPVQEDLRGRPQYQEASGYAYGEGHGGVQSQGRPQRQAQAYVEEDIQAEAEQDAESEDNESEAPHRSPSYFYIQHEDY